MLEIQHDWCSLSLYSFHDSFVFQKYIDPQNIEIYKKHRFFELDLQFDLTFGILLECYFVHQNHTLLLIQKNQLKCASTAFTPTDLSMYDICVGYRELICSLSSVCGGVLSA